eukprot:scaffold5635_cov161-Prasinococcus_capsulatus_cf.AAC.1
MPTHNIPLSKLFTEFRSLHEDQNPRIPTPAPPGSAGSVRPPPRSPGAGPALAGIALSLAPGQWAGAGADAPAQGAPAAARTGQSGPWLTPSHGRPSCQTYPEPRRLRVAPDGLPPGGAAASRASRKTMWPMGEKTWCLRAHSLAKRTLAPLEAVLGAFTAL